MADKEKIIKNSSFNLVGNIFLRISQIIQGLFVASILGPALYGLKNGIQIISDYGGYIHFGALNIFSKERQKYEYNNIKKRDYYSNIVFSFLLLVSIVFILISILCFLFLKFSITIRLSVLIIGFLVPISLFVNFLNIIFQSKNDFKLISIMNLIQAVIFLIVIIILVYFLGIIGYFLGVLIGYLFIILFYWAKAKYKPKFVFSFLIIFLLFKKSIVLFLFSLNFLVFFTIDRLFIILKFGSIELGYYAIGLFFANLMYFFIGTLILPVVPQIYQNINNKVKLARYIIISTNLIQKTIYYVVFMVLLLYPFLSFILPAYSSGFLYINVLIFSILFYPILINNYFIGKNKELFLLWFTSIFVLLEALLDFLVIILNFQPIYIAVATMITFFFYGNLLNLIGYKDILGSYKLAFKEVFNYLWPLGYALIGYGLLWLLAHYLLFDFMNYYIVKVIQAILFTIWYSPILWKIEKEHKILKMIWQSLKNKFQKVPIEKVSLE